MGLDIFVCDRRQLTLSTAGCSRLFVSANGPARPKAWEGRSSCVSCPVGAAHSGKPQTVVSSLVEAMRMLCPRCLRQSDRLIWGRLCASCDARQAEARRGRNAKGSVPALSATLHTQRFVAANGATSRVVTTKGVASLQEALIHASKPVTTFAAFGRRAASPFPRNRQYEMGL